MLKNVEIFPKVVKIKWLLSLSFSYKKSSVDRSIVVCVHIFEVVHMDHGRGKYLRASFLTTWLSGLVGLKGILE